MKNKKGEFKRLPEENAKEARRLVNSLEARLKEISEEARRIQLEDLRKQMQKEK